MQPTFFSMMRWNGWTVSVSSIDRVFSKPGSFYANSGTLNLIHNSHEKSMGFHSEIRVNFFKFNILKTFNTLCYNFSSQFYITY